MPKPTRKPVKKEAKEELENLCTCGKEFQFPLDEGKLSLCNSCMKELYRKELSLNRNFLEEHAEEQHRRLEKWNTALVEMRDIYYSVEREVRIVDEDIKAKKAELDGRIRTCHPDELEAEFGIPKVTENAIGAAIERHPEHRDLVNTKRELLRTQGAAGERMGVLTSCVDGFRDRGAMMKILTSLYCAQYFDRTITSPEAIGDGKKK